MVRMECARCRGTGLPEFVDRSVVEAIYAARETYTACMHVVKVSTMKHMSKTLLASFIASISTASISTAFFLEFYITSGQLQAE